MEKREPKEESAAHDRENVVRLAQQENLIPPQYASLPSEVAEAMWTTPRYIDEKENRVAHERRQIGLAQMRTAENTREASKSNSASEQYAQLSDEQKNDFVLFQEEATRLVAEHIQNDVPIENLLKEEAFIIGKAQDIYKDSKKETPGTPMTMIFGREIDKKVYANLLNRLAFERLEAKKAATERQKLNGVRKNLGLPPESPVVHTRSTDTSDAPKPEKQVSTDEKAIVELQKVFARLMAKATRPGIQRAQEALLEELKKESDRTAIASLLMKDGYEQKRTAEYPADFKYIQAWEYALQNQRGIQTKIENGWNYRGIFPGSGVKTETRASLNINVTPDVVRELDELVTRGILKGNYKFGDPETGASALSRHDAITIYFLENPSEEIMDALRGIAQRNFRGENLLGRKISDGFYISEIGSVRGTHARDLIEKTKITDDKLGKALKSFLTDKQTLMTGRVAMSEGQYYAIRDTFCLYGYDLSYDKEKGFTITKS